MISIKGRFKQIPKVLYGSWKQAHFMFQSKADTDEEDKSNTEKFEARALKIQMSNVFFHFSNNV